MALHLYSKGGIYVVTGGYFRVWVDNNIRLTCGGTEIELDGTNITLRAAGDIILASGGFIKLNC